MDDFLLRALAAGLGIAVVAGPLGSFVVWRRMAFFSGTLAHSALLGVALGFLLGVNSSFTIMAVCVAVALLLAALQNQRRLPNDTLLGILAHSALAVGLIVISFMQTLRVDLNSLLFGDILSVTRGDLYWVFGGGVPALVVLAFIWRPMLALTVHEDLARVEGVPVNAVRVAFVLLFAFIIAVAMKMVGVLLITSLLIIPAATARRFARNPEQMAVLAAVTGCVAVIGGLYASLRWDTPAGPSMVVAAAVLFVASQVLPGARRAL